MKNFVKLLFGITLITSLHLVAMKKDVSPDHSQDDFAAAGETPPPTKKTQPKKNQWSSVTKASWTAAGLLVGVGALCDFYTNGFKNSFIKNFFTKKKEVPVWGCVAPVAVLFGLLYKKLYDQEKQTAALKTKFKRRIDRITHEKLDTLLKNYHNVVTIPQLLTYLTSYLMTDQVFNILDGNQVFLMEDGKKTMEPTTFWVSFPREKKILLESEELIIDGKDEDEND